MKNCISSAVTALLGNVPWMMREGGGASLEVKVSEREREIFRPEIEEGQRKQEPHVHLHKPFYTHLCSAPVSVRPRVHTVSQSLVIISVLLQLPL